MSDKDSELNEFIRMNRGILKNQINYGLDILEYLEELKKVRAENERLKAENRRLRTLLEDDMR